VGGVRVIRGLLVAAGIAATGILGLAAADVSPFPAPVVVVYPLTGTGGTPPDAGSNVAILLSTKLAQLGGLTVKPFTPGTQRPQYLQAALDENADYYITGYLTPVGQDVSLIAQVVSTHSGSVAYATTSVVRTYADIVGQADTLRDAILRHAGRGFPAVEQPAPVPTGTPASSGGTGVNLSKALGHRGRSKATPSPAASAVVALGAPATPAGIGAGNPPATTAPPAIATAALAPRATPSPAPPRPQASVAAAVPSPRPSAGATAGRVALGFRPGTLVTQVDGGGTPDQRARAQTALAAAFSKAGIGGGAVPVVSTEALGEASRLCAATAGSKSVVTASLYFVSDPNGRPAVQLDAIAHDCNGAVLGKHSAIAPSNRRGGVDGAIDRASAEDAEALARLLAAIAEDF